MASRNGARTAISHSPSREEAAAVIAAVERSRRETAPPHEPAAAGAEGWQRAALAEGVKRLSSADLSDPWINP